MFAGCAGIMLDLPDQAALAALAGLKGQGGINLMARRAGAQAGSDHDQFLSTCWAGMFAQDDLKIEFLGRRLEISYPVLNLHNACD